MSRRLRCRYWLELLLAVVSALLLVLVLVRRDWIEAVFGADPDAGSGEVEWLLVATPLAVLLVSLGLAFWEWRRAATAR